ncbi:MAG: hypothetical protein GC129_06610 [Proteobacteria bacterium]|nr:hypothetical protein [Pseudomonadota bacterium]
MKMVKSLLLGLAAGLVAMAGAQAADIPHKTTMGHVKISSAYVAGTYNPLGLAGMQVAEFKANIASVDHGLTYTKSLNVDTVASIDGITIAPVASMTDVHGLKSTTGVITSGPMLGMMAANAIKPTPPSVGATLIPYDEGFKVTGGPSLGATTVAASLLLGKPLGTAAG